MWKAGSRGRQASTAAVVTAPLKREPAPLHVRHRCNQPQPCRAQSVEIPQKTRTGGCVFEWHDFCTCRRSNFLNHAEHVGFAPIPHHPMTSIQDSFHLASSLAKQPLTARSSNLQLTGQAAATAAETSVRALTARVSTLCRPQSSRSVFANSTRKRHTDFVGSLATRTATPSGLVLGACNLSRVEP